MAITRKVYLVFLIFHFSFFIYFSECKVTTFPLRFTNVCKFFCDLCFPNQIDAFCCSVAVLQFSKSISKTLKALLYLYINIEFIFNFHIVCF